MFLQVIITFSPSSRCWLLPDVFSRFATRSRRTHFNGPRGRSYEQQSQSVSEAGSGGPVFFAGRIALVRLAYQSASRKIGRAAIARSGHGNVPATRIQVHRWSDRKKKVELPLFSCYVFVRCALSARDRTRVYQVESVHGFVGAGERACRFPTIKSKPSKSSDAVGALAFVPFLKVGQRVRIRGGAMDGVEGVFLSETATTA